MNKGARRLRCASEAKAYGYGGIRVVFLVTGVAESVIYREIQELTDPQKIDWHLVRRTGGGRKKIAITTT